MLLKYVIGSSSAALLRFLAFLILVKAVGVDDYGIIAFYLSIATIASTLAPLGTYNNTIRRAQENEKLSNILYYFLTPSLTISLIFLVISYFLFDSIELMIYIYFSELFKTVLPSYMYAIINTTGNQIKSAIIQFIGASISILVSIEIYFIGGDYITWAQHYFIGGLISFSLTIIWLGKIYTGNNNIQPISIKGLFNNIKRDKWNTLSIISRTIFFNIDRVILNYILPQYIYGIYSICIRLTASVYLLISNTIHYYESHFFKYGKEKNILEINKLYKNCKSKSIKTISVMFILQVFGILALYLFFNFTSMGKTIFSELNLNFEEFHMWVYFYISLMFLLYPMTILWIFLYMLNGLRMEKDRMLILSIGSIISVVVMYALTYISYYLLPVALLISYFLPIYMSKKLISKRFPQRELYS